MQKTEMWDGSPGRQARGPSGMGVEDWRDILWRVFAEFSNDRVTLIAAGATFYLLLALFPALAAFVSVYGFVADPRTIAEHIAFLGGVLPSGGIDLIRSQLESLAEQNEAALSFGFVAGLAVALWSANNGIKTLFEALNVACEEREKRSFIRLNLVAFVFTLGAIAIGVLFIVSVGVVPAVLAFVGMSGAEEALVTWLRWPILVVASAAAISILYRYGPSRERAKWRWVTWGSTLAALLWLLTSVLFSWYLTNFANYNATYGSLGAVIGFMLWCWISVVILLLGAELNAEIEHQTARDSTTGAPLPMGSRGATMADTLGRSVSDGRLDAPHAFDPSRRLSRRPEEMRGQSEDIGRPSDTKLRSAAALALPFVALGVGLGLGVLDRKRVDRSAHRSQAGDDFPPPPRSRSRFDDIFERPGLRERLAHAAHTALALAEPVLLAQLAKLKTRG